MPERSEPARYYHDRLSAVRLRRCYELATPRIRRYLDAEVVRVFELVRPEDAVLELGCGYGRVMARLADRARLVVGVDTSPASLELAGILLAGRKNCELRQMDAARLDYPGAAFDVVACIQNGISAFHVDQSALVREAVRVTRPGGAAVFSSYSDRFWDERLEWFHRQAAAGLVGEIDPDRTTRGSIVCRDGFTATTVGPDEFRRLTLGLDADVEIEEVDGSSLFCIIRPRS